MHLKKHSAQSRKPPGKFKVSLVLMFSLALLNLEKPAMALGFGCAGVAGEVVFLDTLYGAGTGLVVSGVLEVIRDDHDNWDKRLATGTAIGAGLGLALGVIEVALRDCSESSRVRHTRFIPGWQQPRLAIFANERLQPAKTESIATHSIFEGVGAGLELKYVFALNQ